MSESSVLVRGYRAEDAEACVRILYDAVHGPAVHPWYDARQRRAWAPARMESASFAERVRDQEGFVAEDDAGVAGFMTLSRAGYLDFAYVRPDRIGSGVAAALYEALCTRARALGIHRLESHASELARRFFERRGWRVDERREVERDGVLLCNFAMSVELGPA